MRRRLCLVVVALWGCAKEAGPPPPVLEAVEPSIGFASSEIALTLRGHDFVLKGTRVLGGPAVIDARFTVRLGEVELSDVTWLDERTLRAVVPAGKLPPGRYRVRVVSPYGRATELAGAYEVSAVSPVQLAATVSLLPGKVTVGQQLTVLADVLNDGDAVASAVLPEIAERGGAGELVEVSAPTPQDIPGHDRRRFSWVFDTAGAGEARLAIDAAGMDSTYGAAVGLGQRAPATAVIQAPPSVTLSLQLASAAVNLGQASSVTLTVRNAGQASALVVPDVLGVSGTGGVSMVSAPRPASASVPGGGALDFKWDFQAVQLGAITFRASALARDENNGGAVAVAPVASEPVPIQLPSALSATLLVPPVAATGSMFTVTLLVRNTGQASMLDLEPTVLSVYGESAQLVAGPLPATMSLAGGTSGTFTWVFAPGRPGMVWFSGTVRGRDANDGALRGAPLLFSSPTTVRDEAVALLADPFGDGATFSNVFVHGGRVYLGPDRAGRGGARLSSAGTTAERVTFNVERDVTGPNVSRNSCSLSPLTSVGGPGCQPGSDACGPDDEDVRGHLFGGSAANASWMVLATGRTAGDMRYVYLTPDLGAAVRARYVDLSAIAYGTGRRSFVSGHFWRDRLYLGGADPAQVFGVVLRSMPASPGLDVTTEASALGVSAMPGVGQVAGGTAMIDRFTDFSDRLYLANAGGWMRSTTLDPSSYLTSPSHWAVATPSAPEYATLGSYRTTLTAAIEPHERAVPGMAVFGGRLYVARNTVAGPQLWACDPVLTGDRSGCDPGDWTLVAPNAVEDPRLTQFDNPANTRIGLLAATQSGLYVGFDNDRDGVVVFRTTNTAASARSDFLGAFDCSAAAHPASCRGFGGDGFRVSTNRRFFDGAVLDAGGTQQLFVTVGDGATPVRVYRLGP